MYLKEVLIQIGRTALLCGTLGLALYFAMTYAVEFSAFGPAMAFAGSFALVWLTAASVRKALRSGLIPMKNGSISRGEQSALYWGFLGFEVACACAAVAIAILSLLRLVTTTETPGSGL